MTIQPYAEPLTIAARPELTGGRAIGVLLSHGFTGNPGSMRAWGEALGERGYGVRVPRLPGHGTTWQELNTMRWEDWYGEVSRAFDQLCLDHDAVVVGGLSMGGGLVLQLAADHPDRVSGVILVNPAVATARRDVKLLPVLKRIVPALKGIGSDIKKEGVQEYAYTHTPLRATAEMMKGWRGVVSSLPQVSAPILYFRSDVDHVVDGLSEKIILARVASTDVHVTRLHESYHVATIDNDAEQIHSESAAFVSRVTGA